eukprot:scaffold282102_cov21-Tisochrysis_lutea.AAC.1
MGAVLRRWAGTHLSAKYSKMVMGTCEGRMTKSPARTIEGAAALHCSSAVLLSRQLCTTKPAAEAGHKLQSPW